MCSEIYEHKASVHEAAREVYGKGSVQNGSMTLLDAVLTLGSWPLLDQCNTCLPIDITDSLGNCWAIIKEDYCVR